MISALLVNVNIFCSVHLLFFQLSGARTAPLCSVGIKWIFYLCRHVWNVSSATQLGALIHTVPHNVCLGYVLNWINIWHLTRACPGSPLWKAHDMEVIVCMNDTHCKLTSVALSAQRVLLTNRINKSQYARHSLPGELSAAAPTPNCIQPNKSEKNKLLTAADLCAACSPDSHRFIIKLD